MSGLPGNGPAAAKRAERCRTPCARRPHTSQRSSRFVQAEGLGVVEAPTAEDAMEAAARQTSAVALCDVKLPGRDGLWLVEQFARTYPDLAIVMTTGVQEFETAVTSLRAGVTDYVAKPFTREGLSKALRHALDVHRERRASLARQAKDIRRQEDVTAAFEEL